MLACANRQDRARARVRRLLRLNKSICHLVPLIASQCIRAPITSRQPENSTPPSRSSSSPPPYLIRLPLYLFRFILVVSIPIHPIMTMILDEMASSSAQRGTGVKSMLSRDSSGHLHPNKTGTLVAHTVIRTGSAINGSHVVPKGNSNRPSLMRKAAWWHRPGVGPSVDKRRGDAWRIS